MRDILFKAKAINRDVGYRRTNYKNGDWVYGLITSLYDKQYDFPALMTNTEGVNGIEVDAKTICQYTGLTDKNGTEIWENDILKGLFLHGMEVSAVVIFKDGAFGLKWNRGKVEEFSAFTSICNVSFEIIGNIFDNPELLEGGADNE